MRSAQGVISKPYLECTQEEIKSAYLEMFGIAPCGTCKGIYWEGVYNSIVKEYEKQNNIKVNLFKMSNAKYIWNPAHKGKTVILQGVVVTDKETDQGILEKLFNRPKSEGLILENPNYKEPVKVDVVISPEKTDEAVVLALHAENKTVDEINKITGMSKTKIKKLIN